MEKISGIVCGQGRERLLQFGAEQCLPILVVRPQRLKIRIPQMELVSSAVTLTRVSQTACPPAKAVKKRPVCPQSAAAS